MYINRIDYFNICIWSFVSLTVCVGIICTCYGSIHTNIYSTAFNIEEQILLLGINLVVIGLLLGSIMLCFIVYDKLKNKKYKEKTRAKNEKLSQHKKRIPIPPSGPIPKHALISFREKYRQLPD
jgi:hypothetical protein